MDIESNNRTKRKNRKKNKNKRTSTEASKDAKATTSGRQKAALVVEDPTIDEDEDEDEQIQAGEKQIWRPGIDGIEQGEELDFDPSAYITYNAFDMEWPCLSFDTLRDPLGFHRTKFPMQMYLACGSQAATPEQNKVYIMKISNIQKIKEAEEEDEEGMSEDEEEPDVETKFFKHPGCVNRLRSMPQAANIIATMSDNKQAYIWDAQSIISSVDNPKSLGAGTTAVKPIFTFTGHPSEGYAVDWSPTVIGRLLSGDCSKHIYLWDRNDSGWTVNKMPFCGHTASVEDIQWSPNEANVFASCSVDKTVRIWDTRQKKKSMLFVAAHRNDVNVISWNPTKTHLMLSGSDDTTFKVWDLRKFKSSSPVGHFTYHRAPITSLQWHPTEDAMLAVSSEDNQLTIWDLALEADNDTKVVGASADVTQIPPQLLFVHQGQKGVKELRMHPQLPGVVISTAESGLNIFKPCNL
mmetsp:Transcript_16549/g.40753  ORF Transcript_16549/g.40753 Transcript_16549/m.40753 type:complete len:465 (-) Transcript_16549:189-1583(-)